MFLIIIILSYLLGCASTVALLLYLYTRYVVYSPVIVHERQEEQYQAFNPLPEHERAKNSAVDAVNYLFQFLFQELKDSSRLRRYLMHKLNTEFKELKNSRTGKIFLQNIVIQSFTIGKECPVFSDIQLERQERDERNLIKGFVARLDADYKDGFSVTLDITLLFGHKCLLSIKVNRIQGHLRLEFRREPFCHWLCVFQDEPFIDFEVKSKFASGESPQLAQIITQQLRRAIKRKQTWPSYKIRCQPFFATSKISVPTEVHSPRGSNIIPGAFEITIQYCDRLSIPLAVFEKQKASAVNVFLTISINEQTCAEYLHIQRDQWKQTKIDFARQTTKLTVREVSYMDRTELLIEELEPLPPGIENVAEFKAAMEEKNVFLMKMQGKEVTTRKQMQSLLKYKPSVQPQEGAAAIASAVTTAPPPATTAAAGVQEDRIHMVVGIPLLQSVRVQRVVEVATPDEPEKLVALSPTLPVRSESGASLSSPSVRQRTTIPSVKYEKLSNAVGLPATPSDPEEESTSIPATTDISAKPQDANAVKKAKPAKTSAHDITLVMMNEDLLQKFGAHQTSMQKADSHIDFNNILEFQVGPSEQYLNVCLWCRRPADGEVAKADKKLILLGYAMIPLSEIVLDAHMSYKRETQVTLNFRAPFSPKPNLNAALTDAESKKRLELSTHKGYDENLVNGFVTINIKHRPEIEAKLNPQERKEQYMANAPVLNDTCTRLREAEREQEQKKYINVINEQQDSPPRKPTDHIFEDKTFTVVTQCASCHKKIWMKSGRQCRDCLVTIHRKCEEKFSGENICTHEPVHAKPVQISTPSEDDSKNFVNVELSTASAVPSSTNAVDNIESVSIKNNYELVSMPTAVVARAALNTPNTAHRLSTKAAAAFSALDSTARRSFRGAFGNKNVQPSTASLAPSLSATSELSKSDESLSSVASGVPKKPTAHNSPAQASSKLASAASSAYSKLREYKSRRLAAAADANATKKTPSSLDSVSNENIPEADLRDIITKYLSDESNDVQGLEHLLHERAVDDTVLYAKAREFGQELFLELTLEERKQKLDSEISRLQHEIDLQCQIREEMFHEVENVSIDENEKRKLRAKISNVDEKIQALGALTILYCSGLKHCRAQMGGKGDVNNQSNSELPDGDDQVHFDVHRDDDIDEQS